MNKAKLEKLEKLIAKLIPDKPKVIKFRFDCTCPLKNCPYETQVFGSPVVMFCKDCKYSKS